MPIRAHQRRVSPPPDGAPSSSASWPSSLSCRCLCLTNVGNGFFSSAPLDFFGGVCAQAVWSPQSEGAQRLRREEPEKFQVYAEGGAMLSEEVCSVLFCFERRITSNRTTQRHATTKSVQSDLSHPIVCDSAFLPTTTARRNRSYCGDRFSGGIDADAVIAWCVGMHARWEGVDDERERGGRRGLDRSYPCTLWV